MSMGAVWWCPRRCSVHGRSVAYAMTSLGAAMMNSVFMFYYVKVYINFFHVSQPWFQFAQILFMIWNAINDPLFGYVQDNYNFSWVKSRRHSILYGALPFVVSFLLPWFPWGDYGVAGSVEGGETGGSVLAGVQLLVVLCLYDALFTFVLLAQCALFAEMSRHQGQRLRLVRYSQAASAVGSSAVFLVGMLSDNLASFRSFQVACVAIAVAAFLCMTYTGRHAYTEYDVVPTEPGTRPAADEFEFLERDPAEKNTLFDEFQEKEISHNDGKAPLLATNSEPQQQQEALSATKSSEFSYWRQTLQIFTQRSFVSFVLMNFLQIFHSTFLANFTGILCDELITAHALSSTARSVFYGALFLLPQVTVILGTPMVSRFGYYNVIQASFALKIMLGCLLYVIGPLWWYLIIHFILDNIGTSATFSLFNLCLSDVIDADKEKYSRRHPLSSMVFGTNALVTKPAQSLAPMLVTAILASYGFQRAAGAGAEGVAGALHGAMFSLACAVPVGVGVLQALCWSLYTLRHTHITSTTYV